MTEAERDARWNRLLTEIRLWAEANARCETMREVDSDRILVEGFLVELGIPWRER